MECYYYYKESMECYMPRFPVEAISLPLLDVSKMSPDLTETDVM